MINPIIISTLAVLVLIIAFQGILLYKERRASDKQVSEILKALLARNLQEFSLATADQNLELKKIVEENKLAIHAAELEKIDLDRVPVT